jgi:hypothetical protein
MAVDYRVWAAHNNIERVELFRRETEARQFIEDNRGKYENLAYFRISGDSEDDDGWMVITAKSGDDLKELAFHIKKFGGKLKTIEVEESIESFVDNLLAE